MITSFTEWAHHIHDVFANQKYGGLPYSFHLKSVGTHAEAVMLKANDFMYNNQAQFGGQYLTASEMDAIRCGASGHDLIEDARQTYNDIIKSAKKYGKTPEQAIFIAETIFGCTDSTGRTRSERHDDASRERLLQNRSSAIVKIADIAANVSFGLTTGSDMPKKMKKEWFGPNAVPQFPETHTGLRSVIVQRYPELRFCCEYVDNFFQLVV